MSITNLCRELQEIVFDYRADELFNPGPPDVQTWIDQFPEDQQAEILRELIHVLSKNYISKEKCINFLKDFIFDKDLISDASPVDWWKNVNFLTIQQGGHSQKELLLLFNDVLQEQVGYGIENCGQQKNDYIYLDDVVFSGNRVLQDLSFWIEHSAPQNCRVILLVLALHSSALNYIGPRLNEKISQLGKNITLEYLEIKWIECERYDATTELLRPTEIPDHLETISYVEYLGESGFPPDIRRQTDQVPECFSSIKNKILLEQTFLKKGAEIRRLCCNLPESIRPLGFSALKTLGFGSMIVTFRNCPNTCPLVFWVNEPWKPLFPRKTN